MVKESGVFEPAVLDSEDLLFMLYTSGSTWYPERDCSFPRWLYLLYASLTHSWNSFRLQRRRHFWLRGGHWMDHGPFLRHVRPIGQLSHDFGYRFHYSFDLKCWVLTLLILVFQTGRYWKAVQQRLKINQLYAAPTTIRLLLKYCPTNMSTNMISSHSAHWVLWYVC